MKRMMIATLLSSVAMTGSALAQAAAPDATATDPAVQTEGTQTNQATESSPVENAQTGMSEGGTGGSQGLQSEGGFYTFQEGNQMMASGLMGAEVWGAEGESIGSVDDLLLDREGQVMAVIVGVGGFLGIGEKNVAIANDQLQFVLAEDVAATAPAANAPATTPAPGTAATGTAGSGGMAGQDPVAAPAEGTAATTRRAATGGAGTTGTAGTGMTGTAGMGMADTGTGRQGYGWGWTGAGIDHIQVNYTREQLEAAPEFEAAE